MVLQHPCALRRGALLVPKLLCAPVDVHAGLRSDWAKESSRIMPLPDLRGDGVDYAADYVDLELLDSGLTETLLRIAVLSDHGVNLVSQRWVYHSSRVAIPTITFQEQIAGPLAEADLLTEWFDELGGLDDRGALELSFHEWIRADSDTEATSRQSMLDNPQKRSVIRREMRAQIKLRLGS